MPQPTRPPATTAAKTTDELVVDPEGTGVGDPSVACVVVGRNEAEVLAAHLRSAQRQAGHVVYVDSDSSDDSVSVARATGVAVIELDPSKPLSAARAYNAGAAWVEGRPGDVDWIQFLDGDAGLQPGWTATAKAFATADPTVGVVCGRRREARPRRNVWHRIMDMEWNTAIGTLSEFGPDTLMRREHFEASGGFAEDMIAGEEPELSVRMRAGGSRIVRIDADVSVHDVDMSSAREWWRRARRSGHGFAECAHRHGARPERFAVRHCLGHWFWVVGVPATVVVGVRRFGWRAGAAGAALYGAQVVRISRYRVATHRDDPGDALLYACSCLAVKVPELLGQLEYGVRHVGRRRRGLIEYRRRR